MSTTEDALMGAHQRAGTMFHLYPALKGNSVDRRINDAVNQRLLVSLKEMFALTAAGKRYFILLRLFDVGVL